MSQSIKRAIKYGFDLIIFDEVHTLRNDTNARKSLKSFTEITFIFLLFKISLMLSSNASIHLLREKTYLSNPC